MPKINKTLQQKLLTMLEADQAMRQSPKWNKNIDRHNTAELKKIIKQFSWPHKKLVGEKAATAAWAIAQHADHDIKFQEACLNLINQEVNNKNLPAWQMAYLTDRINVHKNQPQIYGTQFYLTKNKRLINRPIKNKKQLNSLRKKVGLEKFEIYKNKLQQSQRVQKNRGN